MLIAIDIGNSSIVIGVFEDDRIIHQFRLRSELSRSSDEYSVLLINLLSIQGISAGQISGAAVCSVVPPLTPVFCEILSKYFKIEPLQIEPGIKTGVSVKVEDQRSVGADRIVNAVAVKALYGAPAIVVDLGTATTFDVISSEGAYLGGAIAPGIALALDSLVRNTAKLPRIELNWPDSVVGKNTVSAMQSGVLVGYVCMVDGMIERLKEEIGPVEHIVVTGGLGDIVSKHSKIARVYDPMLTLQGLRIIYNLN